MYIPQTELTIFVIILISLIIVRRYLRIRKQQEEREALNSMLSLVMNIKAVKPVIGEDNG